MNKLKFKKKNLFLKNGFIIPRKSIFEKRRIIITEWDNSKQSSDNFHKAISELEKENIPYTVEWKREITNITKLIYFCYSIILDLILLGGIIFALINIDRWL